VVFFKPCAYSFIAASTSGARASQKDTLLSYLHLRLLHTRDLKVGVLRSLNYGRALLAAVAEDIPANQRDR
jgi:hypothetical protein